MRRQALPLIVSAILLSVLACVLVVDGRINNRECADGPTTVNADDVDRKTQKAAKRTKSDRFIAVDLCCYYGPRASLCL